MKSKDAIFLHIPRTGGTSLREQLRSVYKEDFIYDTKFRKARKAGLNLKKLKALNSDYPNNYKNKRFIMGHFHYEKYCDLNLPCITVLRNPIERMKSHYIVSKSKLSFKEFSKVHKNIMTNMTGGNLNNFAFVGILEEFEETIKRLQTFLHIKLIPKHINLSRGKKPKGSKWFTELNNDDVELYQKALKRFRRN